MKIEENNVIFELSEKDIKKLELVLSITGINPDEYFETYFLKGLNKRALYIDNNNNNERTHSFIRNDRDKNSLLNRWSNNNELVNHIIFKSYFIVEDEEGHVSIDRMEEIFNKLDQNKNQGKVPRFRMNFRLLCTDSERCYGRFFNYNRVNKIVSLNKEFEELVLKYKENFLR